MTQLIPTLWFLLYFVVFAGGSFGLFHYFIKRQGLRPPLEMKFLRGPGESLRQRMAKFDDDLALTLPGAALAPVFAGLATCALLIWVSPHLRVSYALAIVTVVVLTVLFFSMRWFLRQLF